MRMKYESISCKLSESTKRDVILYFEETRQC